MRLRIKALYILIIRAIFTIFSTFYLILVYSFLLGEVYVEHTNREWIHRIGTTGWL